MRSHIQCTDSIAIHTTIIGKIRKKSDVAVKISLDAQVRPKLWPWCV